ncbi:MAG: hypothetical protein IKR63_00965 [Alloprevotella sp.]|nr:hypothetical protein [Alloprevotella sp.]
MEVIAIFLGLAWGILNLILFFKIWGATNDIAEMRDMMRNFVSSPSTVYTQTPNTVSSFEQQTNNVTKEGMTSAQTMSNLRLKPGDYIIRNFDNKEYKIEEVRQDGVLVYLGMMGGYRTLKPEDFTVKQ